MITCYFYAGGRPYRPYNDPDGMRLFENEREMEISLEELGYQPLVRGWPDPEPVKFWTKDFVSGKIVLVDRTRQTARPLLPMTNDDLTEEERKHTRGGRCHPRGQLLIRWETSDADE